MHTCNDWKTQCLGGACDTNGPPCQIRRNHPCVRYATSLLGVGYSPGVVTRGLRVSHAPAFNILTFKFTDAILSAIPACDGRGDNAPSLHERAETMRHLQTACQPCSLRRAALALPQRCDQPFKGAISRGSHSRAMVPPGLPPSARICGLGVS